MSITVSIVEDNEGTRATLVAFLGGDPRVRVLYAYPNAESAIAGIAAQTPQVALVDIKLPGLNGIACVAALKSRLPELQVLMLTTYEDRDLIFDSLRAGASGYLLKSMAPAELVQSIEQVLAGGAPMSMQIARKVVDHFYRRHQPQSEVDALTTRESQILALVARGFLYKEIAGALGISVNTVRMHVRHVYDKLHVQSRTEATLKFMRRSAAESDAAPPCAARHLATLP